MSTHPGTYSSESGTTVIGGGIRVNGRIAGSEDLHVEGRVEGSIELSETLHVAPDGVVVAQVRARDVVVSGVIVGDVTAEDSVTLNPGAKIVGDITSPRLIIADGAAFSGNVKMTGDGMPARRARQATRSRPTTSSAARTSSRSSSRASETTAPNVRGSSDGAPNLRRVAAIPPPELPHAEEEATVVVRHAAIDQKGSKASKDGEQKKAAGSKKKAKKAPPRARVPKPGKRRVARRGS